MKNALRAVAVIGALAAAPVKSDAFIMDTGSEMCIMSAADRTGAWDCRQELRPSNQRTPEGVLLSTRLRIEECDGVAVEKGTTTDPEKPGRVSTHVSGAGAAACIIDSMHEVNRELKAHSITCSVDAVSAPTEQGSTRFELSASCDNGKAEK